MLGLSRKKAPAIEEPVPQAHETPEAPERERSDLPSNLQESFRVLEIATLSLDGIAHALGEARMLARLASRPEGAAQRGLIAARYAFLKEQIELRAAEAAVANGERIAIALGADQDGRQGSLLTRALPRCDFATADAAKSLAMALERAMRAVDEETARLRDAAGHVADILAKQAPRAMQPLSAAPSTVPAIRGRRAA